MPRTDALPLGCREGLRVWRRAFDEHWRHEGPRLVGGGVEDRGLLSALEPAHLESGSAARLSRGARGEEAEHSQC